ncbi:MAG TPA: hypothetical protein VLI90_18260 [Tepidisphaeraceae bacterium]|nr:hypothetical protein [Tepidisphaeraceae bacterium]
MTDPRDYKIEIAGASQPSSEAASSPRPFLSVRFACCGVYQRIYRSVDGASYQGRCPRCGKPVKFLVGEGGTDARQFIVY